MEMVWGNAALSLRGLPEDETARTLIHDAHTHLLGSQRCSLRHFQLPAGTLRTRPRTYVHANVHPFIRAHRHPPAHPRPLGTGAGSETASVPARSAAGTHSPWPYGAAETAGVTFGHKHNPVPSCKSLTAAVHQMNTQNLASHTHTHIFL